jgi:hypothetical protein
VGRLWPLQWLTTFQHFRQWTVLNGGVYLVSHLRPGKVIKRERIHGSLG